MSMLSNCWNIHTVNAGDVDVLLDSVCGFAMNSKVTFHLKLLKSRWRVNTRESIIDST